MRTTSRRRTGWRCGARLRPTLPVRRRSQSDGRAAGASVAVARDAGCRQAAVLSSTIISSPDNSLIGATPEDMSRQPGGGRSGEAPERLTLFDETELAIRARTCGPHHVRAVHRAGRLGRCRPREGAHARTRSNQRTRRWRSGRRRSICGVRPGSGPRATPPDRAVFLRSRRPAAESTVNAARSSRSSLSRTLAGRRRPPSLPALAAGLSGRLCERDGDRGPDGWLRRRYRQPAVGHGPRRQR